MHAMHWPLSSDQWLTGSPTGCRALESRDEADALPLPVASAAATQRPRKRSFAAARHAAIASGRDEPLGSRPVQSSPDSPELTDAHADRPIRLERQYGTEAG